MSYVLAEIGGLTNIRTGKLDANASSPDGEYPFFTCSREALRIDSYAYDCDAIIVAGNGDLNVKHYIGKFNAYQRTYIIEISKTDQLDSRYLFHFMNKYIEKLRALSIGGVIKYIKLGMLTDAKIPLPPLPEQRRIAAILDKADAIRRKRQQAIRLTEEFLRSVFLDMFGDPVTNPKGWPQVPIRKLGTVTTGNTPPRKVEDNYGSYMEWIKSDNINTPQHFLTRSKEMLSEKGASIGRIVPKGSILVTCIAGSPDCIGNAAIADRAVAFNQQINAITPNSTTNPYFLYAQLLVAKKHVQKASTESMKGMISKGKFQEVQFLNPPSELQKKYGDFFEKYIAMTLKNNNSSYIGSDLFNSLVQRAFRGEL